MADDLIVTDEAIEDPLVLKRLLSDIIERLSNTVREVVDPISVTHFIQILNEPEVIASLPAAGNGNGNGNGGGAWEKALEDVIPSAATSFDITWDDTKYVAIQIYIDGLRVAVDDSIVSFQVGIDNGATIFDSSGDYSYLYTMQSNPTLFTRESSSEVYIAINLGNANPNPEGAVENLNGVIDLTGINNIHLGCLFRASTTWIENGEDILGRETWGNCGEYHGATDAFGSIDTIRFLVDSGNFIADGKISVYGLLKGAI